MMGCLTRLPHYRDAGRTGRPPSLQESQRSSRRSERTPSSRLEIRERRSFQRCPAGFPHILQQSRGDTVSLTLCLVGVPLTGSLGLINNDGVCPHIC